MSVSYLDSLGMTDLLRRQADILILSVLTGGPLHGYAIIESIRGQSEGALDLPEGTVYPLLHALEQDGFIRSAWSDATGRQRRVYELTAAGRVALDGRRQEWLRFARSVNAVIGVTG